MTSKGDSLFHASTAGMPLGMGPYDRHGSDQERPVPLEVGEDYSPGADDADGARPAGVFREHLAPRLMRKSGSRRQPLASCDGPLSEPDVRVLPRPRVALYARR